jgi:1-deoxy-D-xylulose-5-phosphate reductoisomerase
MKPRKLAILGSTGSIGRSTINVLRKHPGRLEVIALAAYQNVDLLEQQYREFRPKFLCMVDEPAALDIRARLRSEPVTILGGAEELVQLAALEEVDIVLNAVVGAAGLKATLQAIRAGKQLALANKESLVAGGPLLKDICRAVPPRILPVDSEHSAIWQALQAGRREDVRRIILTASGGPFRTLPLEKFEAVSVEQALAHPTWSMGRKITIDSATLANKGLEVMEAVVLFGLEPRQIKVVIHPQSVVHSMVEFVDSSVVAQMSEPDMRLPIAYALFWPERAEQDSGRLDWSKARQMTFEPPDDSRFPLLKLAYEVAEAGGTAPAVYNAANEVAVAAFLEQTVRFTEIVDIVRKTVETVKTVVHPQLEDILEADRQARIVAGAIREKTAC